MIASYDSVYAGVKHGHHNGSIIAQCCSNNHALWDSEEVSCGFEIGGVTGAPILTGPHSCDYI